MDHFGLTARDENGNPLVVHNSKRAGSQLAEPPEAFAEGAPVTPWVAPSAVPGDVAAERALADVGRPWRVGDNCEHAWRRARGLRTRSPQLERAIGWSLLAIAGFALVGLVVMAARSRAAVSVAA